MHAIFPIFVASARRIPKGKTGPGWTGLACSGDSSFIDTCLASPSFDTNLIPPTEPNQLHFRLAITPPALSVSLARDTEILAPRCISNYPNHFVPTPPPLVTHYRRPTHRPSHQRHTLVQHFPPSYQRINPADHPTLPPSLSTDSHFSLRPQNLTQDLLPGVRRL